MIERPPPPLTLPRLTLVPTHSSPPAVTSHSCGLSLLSSSSLPLTFLSLTHAQYELLTTAAQQHGLTLAELRADTASSKAKGKQVKAPRLATAPPLVPKTTKKKTKDEAKEDNGKSAKAGAKSKGKGKERARDEEEEEAHADEDDEDQLEMSEPEVDLGGGFVKASSLKVSKHSKATKRKASTIVADSDEEGADAGSDGSGAGGESGDESEEVGPKRRRGVKGDGKGSKRRKTAG